jgi:hypothetical protein
MLRTVQSPAESLRIDDFMFIGKEKYQIIAIEKIDNRMIVRLTDNFEFIDPHNDIILSLPLKKIFWVEYHPKTW